MRDIGYLFKPELRNAIRCDRKWQTRRLRGLESINECPNMFKSAHQDAGGDWIFWSIDEPDLEQFTKEVHRAGEGIKCPFGTTGDRMYVKEPTKVLHLGEGDRVLVEWLDSGETAWVDVTEQDLEKLQSRTDWSKPSSAMFMLRSFARTTRSLVSVRPVILQSISKEDAIGEGVETIEYHGQIRYKDYLTHHLHPLNSSFKNPVDSFRTLWDSINTEHKWGDRPWWVWRIEWAKGEESE
jgi:hypothetical protein